MSSHPAPKISFRTVEVSDPRWERDGLRHVTVKSAALGQRADLSLFVCPGAVGLTAVPLVILLHGVYGSHWAWAFKGGAHKTAARLIAEKAIPPMVVAMPSDGLWGDGSGYLKHPEQDFERWIVEEVPAVAAHVEPCLSDESPLFIAGLSMGGFAALRLAGKYPKRFRAASAHSAATHFEQLLGATEEAEARFGASKSDYSVLDALMKSRWELPPFRFDCGKEDWLIEPNRRLHEALRLAGVEHGYEEYPGAHDWLYWEQHLEDSLRFFGSVLGILNTPGSA
ncbi:MAG: esterase [Verrucomicrobia bacterium]|nr:esterase [Verrucomicrobiota bacterium]